MLVFKDEEEGLGIIITLLVMAIKKVNFKL